MVPKNLKLRVQKKLKLNLNDSISKGDTFLEFINEFPPLDNSLDDDEKPILDGSAVVEDLDLNEEAHKINES